MVDDEDYERISQFKWSASKEGRSWYAVRGSGGRKDRRSVRMHRFIMNPLCNQLMDHIDGNGLNNQKSNLRICSAKENCRSFKLKRKNASSNFRGVSWCKTRKKWRSQISIDRKTIVIGAYDNETEAALAYNVAASFEFKEFANLNEVHV